MSSKGRAWSWTLPNYTEDEEAKLQEVTCKYMVYGKEVCPDTGTKHLQGYVVYDNSKTFAFVKKSLGPRVHIELSKGSHKQNYDYCVKDGQFWENGNLPASRADAGKRERDEWDEARTLAKEGKFDDIRSDIYIRHLGNLHKIHAMNQPDPPNLDVLEHEWYWGDTGTGKTTKARTENPGAYLKLPNKWWCQYTGQEVVIIDEWKPEYEQFLGDHLKRWADHWSFQAETKHGNTCIRPRKLIVTSNYSLEDCFQDERNLEPLRRRFKVTHFSKAFN